MMSAANISLRALSYCHCRDEIGDAKTWPRSATTFTSYTEESHFRALLRRALLLVIAFKTF